jgi:hypothetical protein
MHINCSLNKKWLRRNIVPRPRSALVNRSYELHCLGRTSRDGNEPAMLTREIAKACHQTTVPPVAAADAGIGCDGANPRPDGVPELGTCHHRY